jgi:hypothetical protein
MIFLIINLLREEIIKIKKSNNSLLQEQIQDEIVEF